METPICDFAARYAARQPLRLHMPGHKGIPLLGPEARDITEIDGADVLYRSGGIIRQSEDNAAALFGAGRTLYSTEGSSLCIRAMLYLTALYARQQGKSPKIAAGRNAHKTFLTAAAMLDLEITWITAGDSVLSCPIDAAALEQALQKESPAAVYLTSPDYLGNLLDIGALAGVCRKYGALLLVDNAHGSYLRFLGRHPIELGADLCCDSAHKTLPVLTGGAYLHLAPTAPRMFFELAENAMAVFASTSPSYLILQSLDAANRYLADGYAEKLAAFAEAVEQMKRRLSDFVFAGAEPLKLTVAAKAIGYTGDELAELLAEQEIVCEFSDPDFVVLMLTPELGYEALERLEQTLAALPKRPAIRTPPPNPVRPVPVLTPRQAMFAPRERIRAENSPGRVLADATVSCPPAIPIVACGERIDRAALECFRYYGIETCWVVTEEEKNDAIV